MPALKHACAPMLDRAEKAKRHEKEIRRIEALLAIKGLDDDRRQALQVELLRNAQAAHALKQVAKPNTHSRKVSFGGWLSPYHFD